MSIAISAPVVEDRFGSLASPLLLHSVSESHDHDEDDYPLNSIAKPKPTPQPSLPSSAAAAAAAATTATTLGSRLRSLPLRLINTGVSILLRIRAMLPAPVRPWFWIGLWLVFALIGLGIFAGFHTKIFELLEVTAAAIKSLGRA
ncbi:hypothetical protein BGW38_007240 [Lunasporangiospora selenospora]|uniref:Uncharacterized protein n=1 Tax=Lunasporangiospora selenospora TaxID=979761 RepID=A0A9P6FYG8_9FUNG|nr:hypothetical protein BGW38_007240 [Lunasporangiospora selenospora]